MHQEPPEETWGELELEVGVDDGDLSFDVPAAEPLEPDEAAEPPLPEVVPPDERLELDEALAWVDAIPGRL